MLQSLLAVYLKGLLMAYVDERSFRCLLRIVSYFRNIPGGKDMSWIPHVMAVVRPRIRRTGTAHDFQNMGQSPGRSVRETLCGRSEVQGGCSRKGKYDLGKGREGNGEREGFV